MKNELIQPEQAGRAGSASFGLDRARAAADSFWGKWLKRTLLALVMAAVAGGSSGCIFVHDHDDDHLHHDHDWDHDHHDPDDHN